MITTTVVLTILYLLYAYLSLIACKLCYKNDIHWLLIGTWALGVTGLITRFVGIW